MDSFHRQSTDPQRPPGNNGNSSHNNYWTRFPPTMYFPPPPLGMPPPPPHSHFDPRIAPPPFFFPPPAGPNFYLGPRAFQAHGFDSYGDRSNGAKSCAGAAESLPDEIGVLRQWLDGRRQKLTGQGAKKPKWTISIPEFRSSLRRAKELNEKLEALTRCLSGSCTGCTCRLEVGSGDGDAIQAHEECISSAQEEMRSIRSTLDKNKVAEVKRKLNERKRKRNRLKRQKERGRMEEAEREEKRRKLEQEIDARIARVAEGEAAVKKKKQVSKEADEILFEVNRKIADVTKGLKMVSTLQKLREVRFNRKAVLIATEITETFEERVDALTTFLKGQLSVYKSERKALQVMLNSEHEADRAREQARKREKARKEAEREVRAAKRLLFGDDGDTDPADPRFPFFHIYDLPSHDLNAFLQVRHQWDQFLVPRGTPGSSKIPPTWVVPPEPSSESWSRWLSSEHDT